MNKISFAHTQSPRAVPMLYAGCGLDNIYLASGYEVENIDGVQYVAVRDVEDLHEAIALYLVQEKKILAGKEIRFLRKFLDLTQRELGEFIGVSDQSVARYEKNLGRLEGASDSLLRLLVNAQASDCIDVREMLEHIRNADDTSGDSLTLERANDEWRVSATRQAAYC